MKENCLKQMEGVKSFLQNPPPFEELILHHYILILQKGSWHSPKKNIIDIFYQGVDSDKLDMVIEMHKLPLERFPDYVENTSGSCWYSSIAKNINTQAEEGKMNLIELGIKTKGPVCHQDVRMAVVKFMESDDCIMAEYWIEQHFGGNLER